jgi:DnaK suppressor protein
MAEAGANRYGADMDENRARGLLQAERKRIEQALANLGLDNPGGLTAQDESEDDGSETLYQAEFDAGLAEDLANQLAALERAEARLAAGTYGLSVESGEPIPDDRLEAVPTAERTLDEQKNRDRG